MRKHIIPLLILCIAALSSCDDSFRIQTVNSEAYIITVGIDYANTEISDLDGTVNDALEMAACLSEIYRQKGITPHVTRMIQEGETAGELDRNYPSRDGILSAIEAVPAGPDDIIVFFYSGHGDILPDGRTILAAARTVKDGPYGELLSEDVFNALNAKGCPVLAIIDACNSGGMAITDAEGRTFAEAFTGLASHMDLRNVQVLAASAADELSYLSSATTEEGTREAHSAFTVAILRELGWVHSASRIAETVAVSGTGRDVMGYLRSVPNGMTAMELFDSVLSSWSDHRFMPVANSTGAAQVRIVP